MTAGFSSIILPLATTNLVTNPSLELNASTGYTAVGGSIAVVATYQRWGLYSLAVTPTSGTTDGVYYGTVSLTSGTTYTASVWVRGVASIPYKIYFANTSGTLKGTATTFTGTGDWQRVEVSWACDSTTTYRIYVTKNTDASTGVFYLDGLQCEAQSAASTYCDGDQDGCEWSAGKHASASTRSARTRAGGQIVNLDSLSLIVEEYAGIGMPELEHRIRSQAFLPGAKLLGYNIGARAFGLSSVASGTSRANLHALRKAIINAIKPDAVTDETQPFLLRYSGANSAKEAEIGAVYDTGLGFNGADGFAEDIPLRLIAYDPFYYEVGESAASLTATTSVSDANYIVAKINGVWQALGTGMNDVIYDIVIGPDGSVYACGAFTTAGGTTVNRIAKWNGSAWSALGTTGLDDTAFCMAIDAAGNLYAGGKFHAAEGTTVNHIAKWNGSAWSALGTTGVDDDVYTIVIGQDGTVYAGGLFHNAAGAAMSHASKWNGSAWAAMGNGFNDAVHAMAVGPDGKIYAVGAFNTDGGAGSVTLNSIGVYDGTAVSAFSGGLNASDSPWGVFVDNDGYVYVGGGLTDYLFPRSNGTVWTDLATSLTVPSGPGIWEIAKGADGMIHLGGSFTAVDGSSLLDGYALYNGARFLHSDIDLPGSPTSVRAIAFRGSNIYLGYGTSGTAVASNTGTITNNGTRAVYPVIKIKRSGGTSARLEWIKNETTGKTLWFDYSLLDGEELTIDLRPTRRMITSSYFGPVWRALLRGSEFVSFALLPGDNLVSVNIVTAGSPTITAFASWRNVYWSADGVA